MIVQLKKTKRKNNRKTNCRKPSCKMNRRNVKRKTNRKNRKQRGGNYNENQLRELTQKLTEIGFTNAELNNFISKINDISQIQVFDGFMNMIRENYEDNKQGLIDWLEEQHPLQTERVETDKEDSDDE
jgi:hypothetical protein